MDRSRSPRRPLSPTRKALWASGLLLLAGLISTAGMWGVADLFAYSARLHMDAWERVGLPPPDQEWQLAAKNMEWALRLSPKNPDYMMRMGRLYMWREYAAPEGDAAAANDRKTALMHLRSAVRERPAWPLGWADIALVKRRAGELDDEFTYALTQAARIGPWEPGVNRAVAEAGLAAWSSLDRDMRTEVIQAMRRGMGSEAEAIYRSGRRHNRVYEVCTATAENGWEWRRCMRVNKAAIGIWGDGSS